MSGLAVCHGASQGVNNGQRLRREGVAEAAAFILPATVGANENGKAARDEVAAGYRTRELYTVLRVADLSKPLWWSLSSEAHP